MININSKWRFNQANEVVYDVEIIKIINSKKLYAKITKIHKLGDDYEASHLEEGKIYGYVVNPGLTGCFGSELWQPLDSKKKSCSRCHDILGICVCARKLN